MLCHQRSRQFGAHAHTLNNIPDRIDVSDRHTGIPSHPWKSASSLEDHSVFCQLRSVNVAGCSGLIWVFEQHSLPIQSNIDAVEPYKHTISTAPRIGRHKSIYIPIKQTSCRVRQNYVCMRECCGVRGQTTHGHRGKLPC